MIFVISFVHQNSPSFVICWSWIFISRRIIYSFFVVFVLYTPRSVYAFVSNMTNIRTYYKRVFTYHVYLALLQMSFWSQFSTWGLYCRRSLSPQCRMNGRCASTTFLWLREYATFFLFFASSLSFQYVLTYVCFVWPWVWDRWNSTHVSDVCVCVCAVDLIETMFALIYIRKMGIEAIFSF